jgi:hypothetical protein
MVEADNLPRSVHDCYDDNRVDPHISRGRTQIHRCTVLLGWFCNPEWAEYVRRPVYSGTTTALTLCRVDVNKLHLYQQVSSVSSHA